MKKLKIFAAIITVELIAVLSLFIWNYTSLSHAVVWDVTSYKLTAQKVHGADNSQKEKLLVALKWQPCRQEAVFQQVTL